MFRHHLIRTLSEPEWLSGAIPANWIETATPLVYLYADHEGDPPITDLPELAGAVVVGSWHEDGTSIVVDEPAYLEIRPLGNAPPTDGLADPHRPEGTRGGDATGPIMFHAFLGMERRELGESGELYPEGTRPFEIEIRHKEFSGGWPGWGWRAEIVGDSSARDPSARAVGVYSDPECMAYLYTTGAFVEGLSDWQTDASGALLTVWFTETPPGWANPEKEDWHLAVLFGSAQEGYKTLSAKDESIHYLYWASTQNAMG